ncbi:hypothetical protein R6G99_09815, partial [Actinotignum timonense]|nr:hypothetical protein [Actinotignum timonense]
MPKPTEKITRSRRSLRGYVNALHAVDPVWNTSVYDVLEHLAELAANHLRCHTLARHSKWRP